jgi:hypothetical protein
MALTKERRGELAWSFWKYRFSKEGLNFADLSRETGNVEKHTDVSEEEIREFLREIAIELAEDHFGQKKHPQAREG